MNKIQIGDTVGVFAIKDYHNTEVVKNMNVDFWYESGKTHKEDCENTGITIQEIYVVMGRLCVQKKADVQKIVNWDLGTLLDYISDTHHQFIRKNAVAIYDLAQKVAYRHSDAHPELNQLVTAMFFFLHDLLNHMMREEQILFPNIKQLLKNNTQSEKGMYTTFGLIKEWVKHMQKEHQSACKNLKLLNELTNNYSTPPDACNSHKSLFRLMHEFEAGFLMLMHIENNILFPKALIEDGESA